MAEPTLLKIGEADDGQRLDRLLKKVLPQIPYAAIQKWLRKGDVRINGKRAKAEARVAAGDTVRLPPQTVLAGGPRTESRDSKNYVATNADKKMFTDGLVYEDKQLLVFNKPAGLPAQAGGGQTRSLDRIVTALWPSSPPKLVHRLDRETTGLIILAKNRTTAAALMTQFAGREVKKTYLALCMGKLPAQEGVVDAPLLKRGPMAVVSPQGDSAQTRWRLVESIESEIHLIEAEPLTGRMNQIRAHMAHIGLPLVGDDKYGGSDAREAARALQTPNTLYLHAWKLALVHPATGEPLHLEAPLPPAFAVLRR
jgi:23S rRNA pseudouridine955/2504/2580 synthase